MGHYMAAGKRVLITSKSSEALNVIRDKIAGKEGVLEDGTELDKLVISWGDQHEAYKRFQFVSDVLADLQPSNGHDDEMKDLKAKTIEASEEIARIEETFRKDAQIGLMKFSEIALGESGRSFTSMAKQIERLCEGHPDTKRRIFGQTPGELAEDLQEDEGFRAFVQSKGTLVSSFREDWKEVLKPDNFDHFLNWFQSESACDLKQKGSRILHNLIAKGKERAETCSQGSAESQGQETGILARASALLKSTANVAKSFDFGMFSPRSMEVEPSDEDFERSELKSELEGAGLKRWAREIDKVFERAAAAVGDKGHVGDRQPEVEDVIPETWQRLLILLICESFLACIGDNLPGASMSDPQIQDRDRHGAKRRKAYKQMVTKAIQHHAIQRYAGELPPKLKEFAQIYKDLAPQLGRKRMPNKKEYFEKRARLQALLNDGAIVDALPIWIMSTDLVSEIFPAKLGLFDIVILEEGSQSDCTAIPALLRGKKLVIVGDSKQVTPPEKREAYCQMIASNLGDAIPDRTKHNLLPGKSLFDLFEMVFSGRNTTVKLKEHFR